MERPTFQTRIYAALIDTVVILVYLILLMLLIFTIYIGFFSGFPSYTHLQSQMFGLFALMLPIVLLFTIFEMIEPFGTLGKRLMHIQVNYNQTSLISSFIRNLFKFLPWYIMENGVIAMFYTRMGMASIFVFFIGVFLLVLYIYMMHKRADGRHVADLIAGTTIIHNR